LFTELLSTFLDDSTEKFTKALYEKVQEIKVSKETGGTGSSGGKKRNAKVGNSIPYKMKIWHIIYFGSLANYENLPN